MQRWVCGDDATLICQITVDTYLLASVYDVLVVVIMPTKIAAEHEKRQNKDGP